MENSGVPGNTLMAGGPSPNLWQRLLGRLRRVMQIAWSTWPFRIATIVIVVWLLGAIGGGVYLLSRHKEEVAQQNELTQTAGNTADSQEQQTGNSTTPNGDKKATSKDKKTTDTKKTDTTKKTNGPGGSTSGGNSGGTGGSSGNTGGTGGDGGNNGGNSGGEDSPPPAPSSWPDASNTGVPAGTTLTNYSGCSGGETNITASNTVIDSKTINCHVVIRAANITIKKSKINGTITLDTDASGSSGWSLTVEDTEVNTGNLQDFPAVGYGHLTILRSNIHGGQHNVQCYMDCEIRDSYLHNPYAYGSGGSASHNNAFISNGGSGFTLVHNTLACNIPVSPGGGGCSGDLSLFGDFSPISNVTIDNNLFVANLDTPYCLYAGSQSNKPYGTQAHDIRVTNNVFQRGSNNKCGSYGPRTNYSIDDGGVVPSGNVWTNNKWDDGGTVGP